MAVSYSCLRILIVHDIAALVYKDTATPSGSYCQQGDHYVVCIGECSTVSCIQHCCPPGHVRTEDTAWTQPRCGVEEVGYSNQHCHCYIIVLC